MVRLEDEAQRLLVTIGCPLAVTSGRHAAELYTRLRLGSRPSASILVTSCHNNHPRSFAASRSPCQNWTSMLTLVLRPATKSVRFTFSHLNCMACRPTNEGLQEVEITGAPWPLKPTGVFKRDQPPLYRNALQTSDISDDLGLTLL
jgi:hypothetical protein